MRPGANIRNALSNLCIQYTSQNWGSYCSPKGEAETETEERGRGETKQHKFPIPHVVDSVTEF